MLNGYSPDQLTAFAALATALIALVAVAIAGWQVQEARRLREASAQPFVVVEIESSVQSASILNLVIRNIGQTLARNVRFEFSPPLTSSHWLDSPESDLNETVMLTEGFPSMPPGFRVARVFEFAQERDPGNDSLPWRFDVTVRFDDHRGKAQDPLTYALDFKTLTAGTYMETYTTHHVAEQLKSNLGSVDKHLGLMNVHLSKLVERIPEKDETG